ncbi:MAG: hypothetical protein IPL46_13475 [Saprospiraceae bacterium]|nr:hypothetical protein [Saprospiraceae bacterium]
MELKALKEEYERQASVDDLQETERIKLNFYPKVADYYESNKRELRNKGYNKYSFICKFLRVRETQVKVYGKVVAIMQQYPDKDISRPLEEIVKDYYRVTKLKGVTIYRRTYLLEETDTDESQITCKLAEIKKLTERINVLELEIAELRNNRNKGMTRPKKG